MGRYQMNFHHLIVAATFFSSISYAATISRTSKKPSNKVTLNLNRNELKSVQKGGEIYFMASGMSQQFHGIVKAIRRQEILVELKMRKKNLPNFKFGTKVTLVRGENRSKNLSKSASSKKSKKSPYEISYKAKGSERARLRKDYSLDLEGGVAVGPTITAGLALGTYLSHNTVLEFNYSQGNRSGIDNESSDLFPVTETLEAKAAVIRIKNFFGNSFYTNAGIGARINTLVGIAAVDNPNGSGSIQAPVYAQSFADAIFEFAIGNKWQLSYFNIGFDWISLAAPLSKIRLENDGNQLPKDKLAQASAGLPGGTQFLAAAEELRPDNVGTVFLTKFYIGFAF